MKWFHLIGVCGKTTANIAKVFQDMGWFVTGSDTQFLPPASKLLEEYKINTVEDYSFKHLTKEFWEEKLARKLDIPESPDLVLFISYLSNKNKEYLYAKKQKLNIKPYAQILGDHLIKPESIVVAGTAGKTTTTALITYILQNLQLDPSYMIGAEVVNIPGSLKITDSQYSVIEGDEYHNPDPEIEGKAKFLEYRPKYLVLTNIGWEHQDIFPTQERYIEEFKKLVDLVPKDGFIVAHADDKNIDKALKNAKGKVVRYKLADGNVELGIWTVRKMDGFNEIFDENGESMMQFKTSLLGDYNLENILAAFIVVMLTPNDEEIPDDEESDKMMDVIQASIENFKGVKKRLEVLSESENFVVMDDFGVAPERAKNSLGTIKKNFSPYKITAIFEPNAGSRISDKEQFERMYQYTFKDADEVIIPDLSTANAELVSSEDMAERLIKLRVNAKYIPSSDLLSYLEELKNTSESENEKNLVVFFSSYRLTEMAEELSKV